MNTSKIKSIRLVTPLIALALAFLAPVGVTLAAADKPITLTITEAGTVEAPGPEFTVKPNDAVSLQLTYTGQGLGRSKKHGEANTWLKITLVWFDAAGKDVDIARAALGFPPYKRSWEVADTSGKPAPVAVNASAPGDAVKARVSFALLRDKTLAPANVEITGITLTPGQVKQTGIPVVITGPADAGPLNKQPAGVKFGKNLVPNPTLEVGDGLPAGWSVIGDNSGGAAQWVDGGAYSGRRAFRIDERGPSARSWGETKVPELGIFGGEPIHAYPNAREEVAARWVSEPVAAEPNALYQMMAAIYYGSRHQTPQGAYVSPVRIQFLDKDKKAIMDPKPWVNWLPTESSGFMLATPGWVPLVGRAVAAPPNAAWVRATVALHTGWFETSTGLLRKFPMSPGFVMVDNIAIYRVSTPRPAGDPAMTGVHFEQAFNDTLAAGQLPFVPTSPAHRPNSLTAESHTSIGAGIIEQGTGDPLGLIIRDKIGDRRDLSISYDLTDAAGKIVHSGKAKGTCEPYRETVVLMDAPSNLPLGPYTINYKLMEGSAVALEGKTRMAMAAKPVGTLAEHSRMDYPFAVRAHDFRGFFFADNPAKLALLGRLLLYMGSGKCAANSFSLDNFIAIADEGERRTKMQDYISTNRALIKVMEEYGVFTIPMILPVPLLTDETRPRTGELVTMLANGLADLSLVWSYGNEHIHGDIELADIDKSRRENGSLVMNWGYQGSARKYIEDYIFIYDTLKKAQPKAMFGPMSAAHANGNVMRMLIAAGAKGKFDLFGANLFMPPFAVWPSTFDVMKQNNMDINHLPLIAHTLSYLGAPQNELALAKWQTKELTVILHAFPQYFCLPVWAGGFENGFFIFNHRVTPAWSGFAAMTRLLGAGRFTQKHAFPGAEVYVRERSVRPGLVGVAWATGETPAMVELNVGVPIVTVTDLWGNPREVKSENGILALTVNDSPQYILDAKKIEPAPSVRIELTQAGADAAKPQFTITVRNDKPVAVGGVMTIDPQAAATVAPGEIKIEPIPSGTSQIYTVQLAVFDPTRDKPLPIKVRLASDDNGRVYESVQPMNFHFAAQMPSPPKVDGILDDWILPESTALVANRADQYRTSFAAERPWSGPEELSGKLWMQWDEKNLYLAARVRDAGQTFSKTASVLWAGDSIEMLIAPLGGQKDSPYTQVALGLVEGGTPTIMRYAGAGSEGPLKDARIAVLRVDGGYVYEAAIPWSDLTDDKTFTPKPGHAIAAVFGFNDNNGGTRMMSWFNHVTYKDASTFGQIVLTGPVQPDVMTKPAQNLVPNGDFENKSLPPADEKTRELVNCENPSEWENVVKVNAEIKRSGQISFEMCGNDKKQIYSRMIPVDTNKIYTLSGWFRSADKDLPASTSFGLELYDKNKRLIRALNVDAVPGTESALSTEAVKGAKELLVINNANWPTGKLVGWLPNIAFNAKDNYHDLPNYDLSPAMERTSAEGDNCRAILGAPLAKTYPAGTKVRLVKGFGVAMYNVGIGWVPVEWKRFTTTLRGVAQYGSPINKFWRGTKYVRVFFQFGVYSAKPKDGALLLADDISFSCRDRTDADRQLEQHEQQVDREFEKNKIAHQALATICSNPKSTQDLSKQWRFQTDPKDEGLGAGWMKPDLNDQDWPLIDAKRCWQDQGYPDYHGVAWYRKTAPPVALEKGQKAFIHFGAVDGDAAVIVNGRQVGEHNLASDGRGWNESIYFEITDALAAGKPPAIAVRVKKTDHNGGICKGAEIILIDRKE